MSSKEKWFNQYFDRIYSSSKNNYKKFGDYFLCPCCSYPTLSERGEYEICLLCSWEDDGQDTPHENEIWGGPNSNYSLKEARENFELYYTMYRPSDEEKFKSARYKKNFSGENVLLDKVALKKDIILLFHKVFKINDHQETKVLWDKIHLLEKKLL